MASNEKRSLLPVAGLIISLIAPVLCFAAFFSASYYNNGSFGVLFVFILFLIMPWVGLALSIAGVAIAKKHDLRGVNSGIVGIVISATEVLLIILFVVPYLSTVHTTPPDYTIIPHYDSEDIESIRATLESRLSDS